MLQMVYDNLHHCTGKCRPALRAAHCGRHTASRRLDAADVRKAYMAAQLFRLVPRSHDQHKAEQKQHKTPAGPSDGVNTNALLRSGVARRQARRSLARAAAEADDGGGALLLHSLLLYARV